MGSNEIYNTICSFRAMCKDSLLVANLSPINTSTTFGSCLLFCHVCTNNECNLYGCELN